MHQGKILIGNRYYIDFSLIKKNIEPLIFYDL